MEAVLGPIGGLAESHVLYPNRKAQGLRGPVEPALSGCVMVTVCWCLALTGEDSGAIVPYFQTSGATCVSLPQTYIHPSGMQKLTSPITY